jgi:hypothetical protein
MNKQTNLNQMKKYIKPSLVKVVIDNDVSLIMSSEVGPPPGDPSSIGMGPGYVQKGIKFLIR